MGREADQASMLHKVAAIVERPDATRGRSRLAACARAIVTSRLRLIDPDWTPFDVAAIQLFDSCVSGFVGRHLDETKPTRSVSRAIHDDLRTIDLTRLRESILQILIRDRPSQITNVQSSTHYRLPAHNADICPVRTYRTVRNNCPN